MSFSSEVKEELSKLSNLANKQVVKYEFLGYLATSHVMVEGKKLKFSTESEYNINRFGKLLNNLQLTKYEIQIIGKTFSIIAPLPKLDEINYQQETINFDFKKINEQLENQELFQKAFVRGCFLGSGSMNSPKNSYHLEVTFTKLKNLEFVLNILQKYNIVFKQIEKKQGYSIYAKDGEEISKFLAFIGANHSVLQFEEIRVYRDVRNNVNRKVNCETANLNKIVKSSLKQINAIEYLKQKGEFEKLSEGIKEIAELRILHPEASLIELGSMLKKPIGKSGVNHRLQSIEKIAEELKEKSK